VSLGPCHVGLLGSACHAPPSTLTFCLLKGQLPKHQNLQLSRTQRLLSSTSSLCFESASLHFQHHFLRFAQNGQNDAPQCASNVCCSTRWTPLSTNIVGNSILLVATILSFVPQLRLLLLRRDSSGLSLYYVLFNLVVSTELFTMAFFWVVNANVVDPRSGSEVFARRPPNTGDWINLAQLTAVWVLWFLTYVGPALVALR
jgi:hypothetical protein